MDKDNLENIDIDMIILENIDIAIDIDKDNLGNIDINIDIYKDILGKKTIFLKLIFNCFHVFF